MAKLDISEVEHIAKLSRLELSSAEKEKFSKELSSVLEYFEKLKEVDVEGVEPCANITGLSNVSRQDEIEESAITHEDIKKNAPEFGDGSFVVPGVFDR